MNYCLEDPNLPIIRILELVLAWKEIKPDEIKFFSTVSKGMAETVCDGHAENGEKGVLGPDNPKVSIRVGNKRYLLCKSCWQKLGLREDE